MFELWIWPFFFFVLGACLGSFGNVIIYRWPKEESIVKPRSRCPQCQKPIRWFHNIPIFSWISLRGKCADCGGKISIRYPVVELITGLLFLFLFLTVGWKWSLIEYLILAFGLVVISFIDLEHYLIPDIISLPGLVLGLVGAWLNPERSFSSALMGAVIGGGFLWLIAYIYWLIRKQEGMGGGDIKLLAWMGAVLGWPAVPFIILSSSVVGSIVGLLLMLRSKKGLQTVLPFGPYLAMGGLIYLLGGYKLAIWYLQLFFPDFQGFDI